MATIRTLICAQHSHPAPVKSPIHWCLYVGPTYRHPVFLHYTYEKYKSVMLQSRKAEREKLNNKSTVKAGAIKAHINAATSNNCHNTNGQNHCKTNHCCPLLITALLLPKPYRCHHACEDCASILEMSLAKTCCTASLFLES